MNRWECSSDERLMESTTDTISLRELKGHIYVNKADFFYKEPIKWVSLYQSLHAWHGKSHLSSPFQLHENHLILQIELT